MKLNVGKAIYNILSQDETVGLKNKIFPLIAENGTTYPFCVYKRNSLSFDITKDVYKTQLEGIVELTIVSDKYEQSIEVAETITEKLSKSKGVFANIEIKKIEIIDASEDYQDDAYIQNITIKIIIKNG